MTERCWICNEPNAKTAEHRLKSSDAKATFGVLTQARPIFLHTATERNKRVQTLRSLELCFKDKLCEACNTKLTQPYDRAWERFSSTLRGRASRLRPGDRIRANGTFPYDTKRQLIKVQLFFVKLFLGMIVEGDVPIPTESFRQALRNGTPHPNVYLKLGLLGVFNGRPVAGASNMMIAQPETDGRTRYGVWLYEPGSGVAVMVMYAAPGEQREGLKGAWHPTTRPTMMVQDFNN